MTKLKILRIISSADLTAGGPIEGAYRVGAALAARGHRQDLMTVDASDMPDLPTERARIFAVGPARTTAHGGPLRTLGRRVRYAPDAVPWLKRHLPEYDVVIVSGLWNYATLAARRALVGGGVPYVVFTHGMLDPWFKQTYPFKSAVKQLSWLISEGPLLRHADAVLFTSEEEKLRARGAFYPFHIKERVVCYGTADVPAGADDQIATFADAFPTIAGHRFLLFLSRIHEKKGCDLLIEAFGALAVQALDLHLVVAGPDESGLNAQLQARAEALGIGARVHWPGMLSGDLKWGAFRTCDAFILPSHQENFGIVVAEAMAASKPVLTTDKVNIWREIDRAGAGIIDSDDLPGTKRLIERFIALDPDALAAMGARARAVYVEKFNIDQATTDLESVLLAAIERARGED